MLLKVYLMILQASLPQVCEGNDPGGHGWGSEVVLVRAQEDNNDHQQQQKLLLNKIMGRHLPTGGIRAEEIITKTFSRYFFKDSFICPHEDNNDDDQQQTLLLNKSRRYSHTKTPWPRADFFFIHNIIFSTHTY